MGQDFGMLMIVCHHLVTQNAFNIDTDLTGINPRRVFLQLIGNHAFVGNTVTVQLQRKN